MALASWPWLGMNLGTVQVTPVPSVHPAGSCPGMVSLLLKTPKAAYLCADTKYTHAHTCTCVHAHAHAHTPLYIAIQLFLVLVSLTFAFPF